MISINDAIRVLEIEQECVKRAAENRCERGCVECDLVLPDRMIYEAYRMAIRALLETAKSRIGIKADDEYIIKEGFCDE